MPNSKPLDKPLKVIHWDRGYKELRLQDCYTIQNDGRLSSWAGANDCIMPGAILHKDTFDKDSHVTYHYVHDMYSDIKDGLKTDKKLKELEQKQRDLQKEIDVYTQEVITINIKQFKSENAEYFV